MELIIVYVILIAVLVVLSAFFSSAETAFIGASKIRLRNMERGKGSNAAKVVKMMSSPETFLSAVLFGNNLVNTAIATLGALIAVYFVQNDNVAAIVSTICVTLVLLVFGEIMPKAIAAHHAERVALIYIRPVEIVSKIFYPFVVALSWFAYRVTGVIGASSARRLLLTGQEIRTAISMWEEEGVVPKDEADMLSKVFDFGDRPVYEAMTPRTNVVWIEQGTTLDEFLLIYAHHPHSRFPVFEGNSDNVIGMILIKDVLLAQVQESMDRESSVTRLVRPVLFLPAIKHISESFTEMRSGSYQLAIVVDEYGGTAGMVTLSQLAEVIVGELGDELIKSEKEFEKVDATTFQIDGSMHIGEVSGLLGIEIPSGDYETVAGFVLSLLGHIPREGEQVKFNKLKLVVTGMRGKKIEKIMVTREITC